MDPAEDPRPLESLIAALSDPDSTVRTAAAKALGARGPETKAAVSALAKRLNDSEEELDADVYANAALALGHIGGEEATAALLRRLPPTLVTGEAVGSRPDPDIIAALGLLHDPHLLPILLHALMSDDVEVRKAAHFGLSQLGKASVQPLIHVLNAHELSPYTRWMAADVLGQLGDQRAVGACRQALSDRREHEFVRHYAAIALGRLGGPGIFELLAATARDDHEIAYVRRGAIMGLGYLPDPRAFAVLVDASASRSSTIRWTAADALALVEESGAVMRLVTLLADSDTQVRYHTVRALGALGNPRALPALRRLQRALGAAPLERMVERAAANAIQRIEERQRTR